MSHSNDPQVESSALLYEPQGRVKVQDNLSKHACFRPLIKKKKYSSLNRKGLSAVTLIMLGAPL